MEVFPSDDPQPNEMGSGSTVSQLEQLKEWDESFASLEIALQAACETKNTQSDIENCSKELPAIISSTLNDNIIKAEVKRKWEDDIDGDSSKQKLKRMNSMLLGSGEVTIQLVGSTNDNCNKIPISDLLSQVKSESKIKLEENICDLQSGFQSKNAIELIKLEPKSEIEEQKSHIITEKVECKPETSELKREICFENSTFSSNSELVISRDIKSDGIFKDSLNTECEADFLTSDNMLKYTLKSSNELKSEPNEELTHTEKNTQHLENIDMVSEALEEKSVPDDENGSSLEDSSEKKKDKRDRKEEGNKNSKKDDKLLKKKKFERCNIRDIKLEDELDAVTLSAQKEEQERIRRLQEAQMRALQERLQQIEVEKEALTQLFSQPPEDAPNLFNSSINVPETHEEDKKPIKSETDVVLVESSDEDKKAKLQDLIPAAIEENIIDISSSSSGNESDSDDSDKKDDDIMVLSDEGDHEGDGTAEDPNNSGAHTNDCFNLPDEEGRVLVNVGHPPEDPDIFLAPQIAKVIKPHQIGGIRFLYDNVVENLERYKSSSGFGCILAHSMGLGKTVQVVSFVDVFLRHTSAMLVLCIVPINTIQNWKAEFDMWVPSSNCVEDGQVLSGEVRPRDYNIYTLNENFKSMAARAGLIAEWRKEGGVLLMGYEMYRMLALRKMPKIPLKKSKRLKKQEMTEPETNEQIKKYMDEMYEHIVIPGPDLVICDEGHRIKNSLASTSMALKSIKTRRRVVLTGYPLQNNLLEYWCMVDFVRPNYLGSRAEFCNMFERPISNGQCIDSTPRDRQLMRFRSHVLHSLLVGFVQRRGHSVLRAVLPKKEEHVLLIRMTSIQRQLYKCFVKDLLYVQQATNPLKLFAVCCKIWNHPDILYKLLQEKKAQEDIDLDIDITLTSGAGGSISGKKRGMNQNKSKLMQRPLRALPKNLKSSQPATNSTTDIVKLECDELGSINDNEDIKFNSNDLCQDEFAAANHTKMTVQKETTQQGLQPITYKQNQYSSKANINQHCQPNYQLPSGQQYSSQLQAPYSTQPPTINTQFISQVSSHSVNQQHYSPFGQSQNQYSHGNSQAFSQVADQFGGQTNLHQEKNTPQSPPNRNFQEKTQGAFSTQTNSLQFTSQGDVNNQYQQNLTTTEFSKVQNNNQDVHFSLPSGQKFNPRSTPPFSQSSHQPYNSPSSQQYSQQLSFTTTTKQYSNQQFTTPTSDTIPNMQFPSQMNFPSISNLQSQPADQVLEHHFASPSPLPKSPTNSQFSLCQTSQQHPQQKSQGSVSQITSNHFTLPTTTPQLSPTQTSYSESLPSQSMYSQTFSQPLTNFSKTSPHDQFSQQNAQTLTQQIHQSQCNENHSFLESSPGYSEQLSQQQQFSQQSGSKSFLQREKQYSDHSNSQEFSQASEHQSFPSQLLHQSQQDSKFESNQSQLCFSQKTSSGVNQQFSSPQSIGQKQISHSPPEETSHKQNFPQTFSAQQPPESLYSQPSSASFGNLSSKSNPQLFQPSITHSTFTAQGTSNTQQYIQPISNASQYNQQPSKLDTAYPQASQQFSHSVNQSIHQYNKSSEAANCQLGKSQNQPFSSPLKPSEFNHSSKNQKYAKQTSQKCPQLQSNASQFNQQTSYSQQSTQLPRQFTTPVSQSQYPQKQFPPSSQSPQQYLQQTDQSIQNNQHFSGGHPNQQFSQAPSISSQDFSQQSPQSFNQASQSSDSFNQQKNSIQPTQQYDQSGVQQQNYSQSPVQFNLQGKHSQQSNQTSQIYNQQLNTSSPVYNQQNQISLYNQQGTQASQQYNQENQVSQQYTQMSGQTTQQYSSNILQTSLPYSQQSPQQYSQQCQTSNQYATQPPQSLQQFQQQSAQSSQFSQQPTNSPQQISPQPTNSVQQFNQLPSQSPQQFSQTPSQSPQQFSQTPSQSPQQFSQPPSQAPQQFPQQPIQSLQQFSQLPTQTSQQPAQSPQQFTQQSGQPPQPFPQQPTKTSQPYPQQPVQSPQQFPLQPAQSPQQFTQQPAQSPQQFTQQPAQSPQQFTQQPAQSPQQFTQQPAQSPQQFTQQPAQSPQQFTQQPAQSPQQFTQQPAQSPQQPAHSPQQFPQQPALSPQQFSQQPSRSPQQFPQQPAQSPQQFPQQSVQSPQQSAQSPQQFSQQSTQFSHHPTPPSQQFSQHTLLSHQQYSQKQPSQHFAKPISSQQFPQQSAYPLQEMGQPLQQQQGSQQLSQAGNQQQYKHSGQTAQFSFPQQCHTNPTSQQFLNSYPESLNQDATKGTFQSEYLNPVQPNISVLPAAGLSTQSVNQQNTKAAVRGSKVKGCPKSLGQSLLPQNMAQHAQGSLNQPPSFSLQAFQNDSPTSNSSHLLGQQSMKQITGNSSTFPQETKQEPGMFATKCIKGVLQTDKAQHMNTDTNSQLLHNPKPETFQMENDQSNACSENALVPFRDRIDSSISYEWAIPIMKDYVLGVMENSHKMMVLFVIIAETLHHGDKLLVFSQSLSTLDLLEHFLGKIQVPRKSDQNDQLPKETWCRNKNYFRLDGSTSAQEREKLINEFNRNDNVSLFLLSTRAGCLGINLVGANRIVVMDASWNPCHDAQAVCRIYRYGQKKQCHIYRLVTDNSLEKRIYDRQVNKQGMSDRVVDELNPESNFTWKDVTTLIQDDEDDGPIQKLSKFAASYSDTVLKYLVQEMGSSLSKEPFEHESLLLDRKDLKLTKQEKRLAKQSYEMAKRANMINIRTTYTYLPTGTAGSGQIVINNKQCQWVGGTTIRVMPNQSPTSGGNVRPGTTATPITASPSLMSSLFKQGVMVQKLTMPSNVSIPVLTPGAPPVVIPAGQDVLVLRTPKGVYLRLPDGRIIAVQLPPSLLAKTQFRPNVVTHFRPTAPKGGNTPTVINTPRGQSIGIIKQTLQCGGTVRYVGPRTASCSTVQNSTCSSAPEVIDLSDDDEPSTKKTSGSNLSTNSSESDTGSIDQDRVENGLQSKRLLGKQITIRKITPSLPQNVSSSKSLKAKCEIPQVLTKNKQITIMPINPTVQQSRQKFAPQLAQPVRVQQMLLQPQQGKRRPFQKSLSKLQVTPLLTSKNIRPQITITQPTSSQPSNHLQKLHQLNPSLIQKISESTENISEHSLDSSKTKDGNSDVASEASIISSSTVSSIHTQNISQILQNSKDISISLSESFEEKTALSDTFTSLTNKFKPSLQISPVEKSNVSDVLLPKSNSLTDVSLTPISVASTLQNNFVLDTEPSVRSQCKSPQMSNSAEPLVQQMNLSTLSQPCNSASQSVFGNNTEQSVQSQCKSPQILNKSESQKFNSPNFSVSQGNLSHITEQTTFFQSKSQMSNKPESLAQQFNLAQPNLSVSQNIFIHNTEQSDISQSKSPQLSNKLESLSQQFNTSAHSQPSFSISQSTKSPIASTHLQSSDKPFQYPLVSQANQHQISPTKHVNDHLLQLVPPTSSSQNPCLNLPSTQLQAISSNQLTTTRKKKSANKLQTKKSPQEHSIMTQSHPLPSTAADLSQQFRHHHSVDNHLPESHFSNFSHHISSSDFQGFTNFSPQKSQIQHPQPLHPLQQGQDHCQSLIKGLFPQPLSHLYPISPHLTVNPTLTDMQSPAPRAWSVPQPSVSSFHPFSQSSPFFSSGQNNSQFSFPPSFSIPPSSTLSSTNQLDSNFESGSSGELPSQINTSDL